MEHSEELSAFVLETLKDIEFNESNASTQKKVWLRYKRPLDRKERKVISQNVRARGKECKWLFPDEIEIQMINPSPSAQEILNNSKSKTFTFGQ